MSGYEVGFNKSIPYCRPLTPEKEAYLEYLDGEEDEEVRKELLSLFHYTPVNTKEKSYLFPLLLFAIPLDLFCLWLYKAAVLPFELAILLCLLLQVFLVVLLAMKLVKEENNNDEILHASKASTLKVSEEKVFENSATFSPALSLYPHSKNKAHQKPEPTTLHKTSNIGNGGKIL